MKEALYTKNNFCQKSLLFLSAPSPPSEKNPPQKAHTIFPPSTPSIPTAATARRPSNTPTQKHDDLPRSCD
jgi:hypothetical protein